MHGCDPFRGFYEGRRLRRPSLEVSGSGGGLCAAGVKHVPLFPNDEVESGEAGFANQEDECELFRLELGGKEAEEANVGHHHQVQES